MTLKEIRNIAAERCMSLQELVATYCPNEFGLYDYSYEDSEKCQENNCFECWVQAKKTPDKMITLKDVVRRNNPECISKVDLGGVIDCPADYPYLNDTRDYKNCTKDCKDCWNRPYIKEKSSAETDSAETSIAKTMVDQKEADVYREFHRHISEIARCTGRSMDEAHYCFFSGIESGFNIEDAHRYAEDTLRLVNRMESKSWL